MKALENFFRWRAPKNRRLFLSSRHRYFPTSFFTKGTQAKTRKAATAGKLPPARMS
jgi:hypothetical protein